MTLRDGRTLNGTSTPGIHWGTTGERILKAELLTPIVAGNANGRIVIDFDIGANFTPLPLDGPPDIERGFAFLAVLNAVDPAGTGSIAGRVVAGSGGAATADASLRLFVGDPSGSPETWSIMATGTTDAAGAFRLAHLAPSARWADRSWVYILAVDPPTGSPFDSARLEPVDVLAGCETAVGDVIVQPKLDLRDNRIAFLVEEAHVFSIREDGSNRPALTDYPSGEYERTEIAAWSPDGTELLGMREEITPLDEKIVAIAGDDSGARFIAQGSGAWVIYPGTWSPDGNRLAYVMAHASHGTQLRIHPDRPEYLGYLGTLAARRGDGREAERICQSLASLQVPYLRGAHTHWRARIAATLGQKERAVALLADSFQQGQVYGPELHTIVDFEPLRDYPPYVELVRPKG